MILRRFIIAFLLLSTYGCRSLGESFAETAAPFIAAPFIINAKLLPLAYLSSGYQDSLGFWPSEINDISTFYLGDKTTFAQDSLYLPLGFDENDFETISFSNYDDNLKIDFTTKFLEDGIDSSMNKKNIYYLKAEGTLLVFPKSSISDSSSAQVDHIDVSYFDLQKNKIESLKVGS